MIIFTPTVCILRYYLLQKKAKIQVNMSTAWQKAKCFGFVICSDTCIDLGMRLFFLKPLVWQPVSSDVLQPLNHEMTAINNQTK